MIIEKFGRGLAHLAHVFRARRAWSLVEAVRPLVVEEVRLERLVSGGDVAGECGEVGACLSARYDVDAVDIEALELRALDVRPLCLQEVVFRLDLCGYRRWYVGRTDFVLVHTVHELGDEFRYEAALDLEVDLVDGSTEWLWELDPLLAGEHDHTTRKALHLRD